MGFTLLKFLRALCLECGRRLVRAHALECDLPQQPVAASAEVEDLCDKPRLHPNGEAPVGCRHQRIVGCRFVNDVLFQPGAQLSQILVYVFVYAVPDGANPGVYIDNTILADGFDG